MEPLFTVYAQLLGTEGDSAFRARKLRAEERRLLSAGDTLYAQMNGRGMVLTGATGASTESSALRLCRHFAERMSANATLPVPVVLDPKDLYDEELPLPGLVERQIVGVISRVRKARELRRKRWSLVDLGLWTLGMLSEQAKADRDPEVVLPDDAPATVRAALEQPERFLFIVFEREASQGYRPQRHPAQELKHAFFGYAKQHLMVVALNEHGADLWRIHL